MFDLSRPYGGKQRCDVGAYRFLDGLEDLQIGDLDPSSQIVDGATRAVKGEDVCVDDISDVAVVSRLTPISENGGLLTGEEL